MAHRWLSAWLCCVALALLGRPASGLHAVEPPGAPDAPSGGAVGPAGGSVWRGAEIAPTTAAASRAPSLQEAVSRLEYEVAWQPTGANGVPAGWQAPNRAQDLRFGFAPDRVTVRRRTGGEGEPAWALALSMVNGAAGPPGMTVDGETVTVVRDSVRETFVNEPDGLRHEIDLDGADLAGLVRHGGIRGATGEAVPADWPLVVTVSGRVRPRRDGASALELRREGRVVGRYVLESARDAAGREWDVALLPLSPAAPERWRFGVVLAGVAPDSEPSIDAAAPPDHDRPHPPLRLQARIAGAGSLPAWRFASNVADAHLGASVATAGDVNGDGYSDVLVGAPAYDGGQPAEGRAFLFYGSASGPSGDAAWWAESNASEAYLGHAVATAGDVNGDGLADIVVGAPRMPVEPGPQRKGAALVWYGSSTGLGPNGNPENADWYCPGYAADAAFGVSVATAGDVDGDGYSDLIVGMPGAQDPTPTLGSAYLFAGSPAGLTDAVAWLRQGDAPGDGFGLSVATAGDVDGDGYADVAVGAPLASRDGRLENGAAYVFPGSADGPAGAPTLAWGPDDDGAHAGMRVATAGDVDGDGYADLVVGAPSWGSDGNEVGAVFLFEGSFAGIAGMPAWTAYGDAHDAGFGLAAATAGDVNGDGYADLVVGQPSGSKAFAWLGGAEGMGATGTTSNAAWRVEGHPDSGFGFDVATVGDVDGDGYSDLVVGAPARTRNYVREGEAYVYLGGPDDLAQLPGWTRASGQEGAGMGSSVAPIGDVDGDGFGDFALGAPDFDQGDEDEGAVFVWRGSAAGPVGGSGGAPSWRAYGGQPLARLGASVAGAGDVDGDGFGDLIAGAPGFDGGQMFEGAAFVWLGAPAGLGYDGSDAADGASWRAESDQSDSAFGASVAGAGDVNGDGCADVVVGARAFDNGQVDEGAVFVWHGSLDGLGNDGTPLDADWRDEGDAASLGLGVSVSAAGDVNRDGYGDLIAGGTNIAAAWLGSSSGLETGVPGWLRAGGQPSSMYGYSVAGAGDVNGDGYADIVVGAPLHTGSVQYEGAAWAYCGGSSGPSSVACWTDLGGRSLAAFGWSVGSAGDLNGDGYADIAVGAPGWSNGHEAEGQVRAYYGSVWAPVSYNGGDWARESNVPLANLGYAVSSAGDVNGDAYAELLAGAPRLPNGAGQEGGAWLYYGNGHRGRPVLARQLWPDGLTPIAQGGRSNAQGAFDLHLLARSPSGRGKLRVTHEVKPLSTPFDGAKQLVMVWHDSGTTGHAHEETVTGLAPETPVHWRARVQHHPVTSPFDPPFSRWVHVPVGGWNETDLRTSGAGHYIVNSDADDAQTHDFQPGDGICADYRGACSLRAALEEANAHPGPDEITFLQSFEIEIAPAQGGLPAVREVLWIDASGHWDTAGDRPGVTLAGGGGPFDGLTLQADLCAVYGLHVTGFGENGIRVASADNAIGGPSVGQGNVLSGNAGAGVLLDGGAAQGNRVQGNRIGLSPDGTSAAPNDSGVVAVDGARRNLIGGTGPGEGNAISGNAVDGILVTGAGSDENRIGGNRLGVAATGTAIVPNGRSGVTVANGPSGTMVGEAPEHGNLVQGNGADGVYVNAASGTTVVGARLLHNARHGLQLSNATDSLVIWNSISGNGGDGVRAAGPSAARNRIGMNSITANDGKGIGLVSGAHGGIQAPAILGGSDLGVSGTTCPGCTVQVSSDDDDEGRVVEGVVPSDPASGAWTLVKALTGPYVTAVAIDPDGDTSEFSAPFDLGAGNTLEVDDPGDGPAAHDDNLGDGVCRAQVGGCTLRAALEESNALPTRDRITFERPMTITLDASLTAPLTLSDPATLDAGGVWDVASDAPGVRIDGAGGLQSLLIVAADDCRVYGLHLANTQLGGVIVTGTGNEIGGPGTGQRNVITGCHPGVSVRGPGAIQNRIQGNYVGVDATGAVADGNTHGIWVELGASGTWIGGTSADEGNVIAGNDWAGICIEGADTADTRIGGNTIGLAADDATPLPNGNSGILVKDGARSTTVGGGGYAPNVIAGNDEHGIHVDEGGSGTTVNGNTIGLNGWSGVGIDLTAGCLVQDNEIAANAEAGVTVHGGPSAGNALRRNRIHHNGVRGIRLLNGANADIAPPVVLAAGPSGASGTACASCVVELFSDEGGQGETYHGRATADGSGAWDYSGPLSGPNVTATQTDGAGNTSEFCAPVSIVPTPVPSPTDAPTPTPTETTVATATRTATATLTPLATAGSTATRTSTAGPSPTTTRTPPATPSPTASRTPRGGASPTASPTATRGPSTTPGASPTASRTPRPDETPPEPGAGRIFAPFVSKRGPSGRR